MAGISNILTYNISIRIRYIIVKCIYIKYGIHLNLFYLALSNYVRRIINSEVKAEKIL